MSFIPQVTCRNCGAQFSIIRPRCPNCGARYVRQTIRSAPARASDGEKAEAASGQWQLFFGGILIVAVIIAVIILITASLNPPAERSETAEATPPMIDITEPPEATETPDPTPSPTPTVPVSSIVVHTSWGGDASDITIKVDESADLDADVYPTDARPTATFNWRSTDESVATVDQDGIVTGVSAGTCQIIVDSGGVTQQCIIRVRG